MKLSMMAKIPIGGQSKHANFLAETARGNKKQTRQT